MAVLLAALSMKVLIAENDPGLVKDIYFFLTEKGCSCEIAASLDRALTNLASHYYDAIVVHLSSLERKEIQLLKFLKTTKLDKRTVLTYEASAISSAQMNASSIQYLRKPYILEVLFDKISVVGNYESVENNRLFYFNELIVDVPGRTVKVKDQQVDLTRTEFDMLHLFLQNRALTVSKTELAQYLARKSAVPLHPSVLYAHIKNLKKKLNLAGCKSYIKTIYGVGYRFER